MTDEELAEATRIAQKNAWAYNRICNGFQLIRGSDSWVAPEPLKYVKKETNNVTAV